jgi:hypothetical protein
MWVRVRAGVRQGVCFTPPISTPLLLAIAIAGLLAAPCCASARTIAGEAFLCAEARSARAPHGEPPFPTFHPRLGVPVVDRFSRPLAEEHHTLDLRKPEAWCRPVRLDDAELTDELHGFEMYDARRTRRKPAPPPFVPVAEKIVGTFGGMKLRVTAIAALAVPTAATGAVGGTDPNLEYFSCYDVRAELPATERRRVRRFAVRTRDSSRLLEIRKPTRLCVPASVRGENASAPKHPLDLLCYEARRVREKGAPRDARELLATRNDFGHEVLRAGSLRQLCVWARSDADVPSPTPPVGSPARHAGGDVRRALQAGIGVADDPHRDLAQQALVAALGDERRHELPARHRR